MVSIKMRADIFIAQQPVTTGAVVAVNENLARYLVGAGRAEYVNAVQPEAPVETATIEPQSKAVALKAKKR